MTASEVLNRPRNSAGRRPPAVCAPGVGAGRSSRMKKGDPRLFHGTNSRPRRGFAASAWAEAAASSTTSASQLGADHGRLTAPLAGMLLATDGEMPRRSRMRFLSYTVALMAALAPLAKATDGMLEINQTCALQTGCFPGDTPGFPVLVSSPGKYKLTGALDAWEGVANSVTAIVIDADNVAIDFNDCTVRAYRSCIDSTLSTSREGTMLSNGSLITGS